MLNFYHGDMGEATESLVQAHGQAESHAQAQQVPAPTSAVYGHPYMMQYSNQQHTYPFDEHGYGYAEAPAADPVHYPVTTLAYGNELYEFQSYADSHCHAGRSAVG